MSESTWLIVGANGQLGRSLCDELTQRNVDHRAFSRDEMDVTNAAAVAMVVGSTRPSVIVNASAWTAVDAAETHRDEAFAVNADGALNLARAARDVSARLVHVSTDYVFSGDAVGPNRESDPTGPTSEYGRSKLAGEHAVMSEYGDGSLIVRTAWLYSPYGKNFVKSMIGRALDAVPVRVVDDQRGQPTAAADLASHIADLVDAGVTGIVHGTNSGETTWFGLTRAVYRLAGASADLVASCSTADYPTPARRPRNSVLAHDRTVEHGVPEMRPWDEALAAVADRIVEIVRAERKHLEEAS